MVRFAKYCPKIFFFENLLEAIHSDANSWWAGWALVHLEFGVSVNPISTRGADYAHHSTMCLVWLKFVVAPLICIN